MTGSYLLSLTVPVASAFLALTFLFVWRWQPHRSYIADWALLYGCAVVASTVEFARIFGHGAILSIGANALYGLVGLFTARSLLKRYGGQDLQPALWLAYAAGLLGVLAFTFLMPNVLGRSMTMTLAVCAILFVGVSAIFRARPRDGVDNFIAGGMVTIIVLLLIRPVATLAGAPQNVGAVDPHSFYVVSLKLLALVGWIGLAILFLLRTALDLTQELQDQARRDPLTGLLNRRGFFERAQSELSGKPAGVPCSVLLIDIDHFKQINDRFGHGVGDEVIRAVGTILARLPFHPIAARIGGEEFAILLPTTPIRAAALFGEGIRTGIAAWHDGQMPYGLRITGSIGVAEFEVGGDVADALRRADIALYAAKRSGRDKVCCADEPEPVQGTKRA
jgi:diguanylate cyclase (GGDEF)-like protein